MLVIKSEEYSMVHKVFLITLYLKSGWEEKIGIHWREVWFWFIDLLKKIMVLTIDWTKLIYVNSLPADDSVLVIDYIAKPPAEANKRM
jgi:hypothetical protein